MRVLLKKPIIRPTFTPLNLGPLPCEILKRCLGLTLADGEVYFSIPAQRHAFDSHPDTYLSTAPFISAAVELPTHVGQAPQHKRSGFELIKEVPHEQLIMLMAVHLTPTNQGVYYVKSVYPIDHNKLSRRLRKGWVIKV